MTTGDTIAGRSSPTRLVISMTPLSVERRRELSVGSAGSTEFREVSALRRGGVVSTIKHLRSICPREVVVTGSEIELSLFGDMLGLLAAGLPGSRRFRIWPNGRREPVSLFLPGYGFRMTLGAIGGLSALVLNELQANRLVRNRTRRGTSTNRYFKCLYLRPTLMFGVPVGGSVGHVAGVLNALDRADISCLVVAMWPQPGTNERIGQRRIQPEFRAAYPQELNQHRYQRAFTKAARSIALDWRPDFIYERYTLNSLVGAQLRSELGIPLVVEFNGSEVWVQKHWGRPLQFEASSARIERAALLSADVVVAVSEGVAKQALSLGVARDRVVTYPNCVDTAVFDPARFGPEERKTVRERLGVPLRADLFTFVGTFGQWHGTDVLARAIRTLIDGRREWLEGRRIHFLYVGDGHLAPRVREILGPDLGSPFVTLAGLRPQDDTPGILAASDFLLSPHAPNADGSPFFGSPTKLFEYMAMARPIIASDLDQIGWVLKGWRPGMAAPGTDGKPVEAAALLVGPGNVEDLVAAIEQAADMTREHRETLGRRTRELVLSVYTWERNVSEVLRRVRSVVGGQP